MLLQKERETIVEYGQKLIKANLTTGSGGNLSLYNREEGLVALSPSGLEYFDMKPEDVVVMTVDGEIVDGDLIPSSEKSFHLALLKHRPDITSVVHTHQVYATTIACMNWELPAVHYLVGFSGNKVPLAKYATFGSKELADNILNAIGSYNACLLANHGLVTVGNNMATAFAAAEEIELVAQIYFQTRAMGQPVILDDAEMEIIAEKFKTYGQK